MSALRNVAIIATCSTRAATAPVTDSGIGMAAQQLRAAARFGTSLAVKEVAICVVGAFYL